MKSEMIENLARAVLYEGYVLYPYRPSVKNRQRWTFGGIYPQAWNESRNPSDACAMQTQVLATVNESSMLRVTVRFLHLIDRAVFDETGRPVPSLVVGERTFVPWQEAEERSIDCGAKSLRDLLAGERSIRISLDEHRAVERVEAGSIVRHQYALRGTARISAVALQEHIVRITVRIENETTLPAGEVSRDEALLRTLASTHAVLAIESGEFVSSIDPPTELRDRVEECRNIGAWPVLVGQEPARDVMLAAPIILYDYPKIAAQSPGDLFDSGEIDEILSLRIQTLTDEEKSLAAATDSRVSEMIARTDSLAREQLMSLHGTMGNKQPVLADGIEIKPGGRVRLRPLGRADVFDIALDGKLATVVSVEQDFEDRIHVAVTVDDDPGKDLGASGQPGHRFFFGIDEVEPIA